MNSATRTSRYGLTITAVEVLAVEGIIPARAEVMQPQVRALDRYGEHRIPANGPGRAEGTSRKGRALYLRITCGQGPEGVYGPVDEEAANVVLRDFRRFLIGEDALAVTITWDKLQRLHRHARHGHMKMAISAIDNTLWDLRGRAFGAPVWQLLGGSRHGGIPAYASTLGRSHEEGRLRKSALELRDAGYRAQKWFFRFGPGNGPEGLRANVDLVRQLRQTLGDQSELMFDAYMGWDVRYTQEWSRSVEGLAPSWLEEPLSPGHYAAFGELRRSVSVPLAAGEHLYDRAEVLPFLQQGILSVLQTDPEWCGGTTELVRVCALADAFGVPVIPHGHGLHAALHVVASQSPEVCPMVEYLTEVMPERHWFDRSAPMPVNGSVPLSNEPGFGISFDEERVEKMSTWNGS